MMTDRSFTLSACTAITTITWALVVVLVATYLLAGSLRYGVVACPASAFAATCSVRGYLLDMARNQQNTFDLGRDAGRAEVRRLGRAT